MIGGPGRASNLYVNIYGMKEQGKTTLLRQLYARAIAGGASGTFIDTTYRNSDLTALSLTHIAATVRSTEAWFAAVRESLRQKKPYNLVFAPTRSAKLDALWDLIYVVGNCLVAIDEAERWVSQYKYPPKMAELVNWGRNRQVSIFSTVRRPQQLHRDLRGNADVSISFRVGSALDAAALENDAFHSYPRVAELLVKLPQFQYLEFRDHQLRRGEVQP